ncbi:DNRLRE domain-containing protein [Microbacterium sp. LWH3-1.2]|uniref:DNRLRE domain-containing protein n=1 Tax=Microbacterium sp. LWH3-1.2 TaxID=3135256 RepID=UPI00342780B1
MSHLVSPQLPRTAMTGAAGVAHLAGRLIAAAAIVLLLAAGMVLGSSAPSQAEPVSGVVTDDASVRESNPTTNYGDTETLIVRNDVESYIRLDVTKISGTDLASVQLKLQKTNSANKIVISQASEYLTDGGVETTTRWNETNLTWATKPLDLAGTQSLTVDAASGTVGLAVTITSLVTEAKARGADALTLRLTTTGTVGTDIYSTGAADATLRPVVDAVYGIAEHMIKDNAWVRTTAPSTNYGTATNLVVGKGGHAYIRLDISQIDPATLSSVVLNITKYNNAATILATRASEFSSNAGATTTTRWTETSVTYNTRPLDAPNSPVVTKTVPTGTTGVALDVTPLVQAAKGDGANALTVHLTTDKVDDLLIAGTDIYSTRATNPIYTPWVAVTGTNDEIPVDYPIAQRFRDYAANAHAAQDVVHIADADGRYLHVEDETGRITVTEDEAAATPFAIYGYDYTASEYDGTGGGQQTTYAIKSLSNGKFLTIQNYSGDEGRPYYTKSDGNYLVSATADAVKWNERFSIASYPESGRYTISSHLDALRDGAEAPTVPVNATTAGTLVQPGDRGTHYFTFESLDAPNLLEVQQRVTGTTVQLSWVPVNDDTDAAHYSVNGATVSHVDGVMTATVRDQTAGTHEITVSYTGGGEAVEDTVVARVFDHPGVSLTTQQLDAMREHVVAKAEPWYSDYLRMKNTVPNSIASLDFDVVAHAGVGRGSPEGSGNIRDYEWASAAAYFHALQWVITGDGRHADKAVEILNAWSGTLTQIDGRDQILGAGLGTLKLINAAEIVRYYDGGYPGYSDADFAAFQSLVLNVVYPVIQDAGAPMNANGNWDAAAMVTLEAIGVVTDNATIYDEAVAMYKSPFINGSVENYVTDWGQTTESARDQAHAMLGLGLLGDFSAIAYNQGLNLWKLDDNKLARAYNWVAEYNLFRGEGTLRAEPVPNVFGRTDANAYWDEMDEQAILRGQLRPIFETALAYYSTVDGVDVTWMKRAAEAMRPQGFVHFDNLNFGTLTSYNGGPTEATAPYFQLRTMLTPWYQRTWSEVTKWGSVPQSSRALTDGGVLPADYVTETLDSYFAVQPDGTVAVDTQQADAPFFRLVTNDDETYSIQEVATGRFLGVTPTLVNGENVITASALVVGEREKFVLRSTGLGRSYLVQDRRLVKVAVDGSGDAPREATLSLRLGTKTETISTDTTPENALLFSYNTRGEVDQASVEAHDSTLVAGDSWSPADNIDSAVDYEGNPVEDLASVQITGTVDPATAGRYAVTYHSGTAAKTVTVTVVAATAPTVAVNSGGGTISRTVPVKVSGSAAPGNSGWSAAGPVVRVELRNGSGAVVASQNAPVADGKWGTTFNLSSTPGGAYVIAAVASSRSGGDATATTALKLKAPGPATAAAGASSLSSDNWDGDGRHLVTMNMWWGQNAWSVDWYENGVPVSAQVNS